MFKAKLALFLASVTVSLSASASWVQYTFQEAGFDDGTTLQGYFIQDTTDRSIAYYDYHISGGMVSAVHMVPNTFINNLLSASNSFYGAAPSNFEAFDDAHGGYYQTVNLMFTGTDTVGRYRVGGWHEQFPLFDGPNTGLRYGFHRISSGFVVESDVLDAGLAARLKAAADDGVLIDELEHIVPTVAIPEPGSLALMLLGGLGLLGFTRRRTTQS